MPSRALLPLFVFLASAINCSCQAPSGDLTYVEYAEDFKPRLAEEQAHFIKPSTNGDGYTRKVEVRAFQVFPEPPEETGMPSQHIWPVLDVMIKRMDGVMSPIPHYFLQSGDDYGCREGNTAVDSDHCHRHCTHKGRYCAPQTDSLPDGKHGRDAIYEIIRRLCFDQQYPATSGRFLDYLKGFDDRRCFDINTTQSCSIDVMASISDSTDYEELTNCLGESAYFQDQPHELLQESLQHFTKYSFNYSKHEMPQIEIQGNPIMPSDYSRGIREWSHKFIFNNYCHYFPHDASLPYNGQPLACEICLPCQDVHTCLWNLECDGVAFDAEEFQHPHPVNTTTAAPDLVPEPEKEDTGVAKDLTYVEFDEQLKPRLAFEQAHFITHRPGNGSSTSIHKVEMRAFQIFPESPEEPGMPSQHIWPVLDVMVKRMGGVMSPRPHYFLQSGEDFGCRQDGNPVDSSHCQRHCTHQGRYCAPQIDSLPDGKYGYHVIQEIIRRLCFDQQIPATSGSFLKYLQGFDERKCFNINATQSCSKDSMAAASDYTNNYEDLVDCLGEHAYNQDQPHELLDDSLEHFSKYSFNYSRHDMPQIEIKGNPIMPSDYSRGIREWSHKFIFDNYCHYFPQDSSLPYNGQPLACEVCSPCQDVHTCLWNLECDGVAFDAEQYHYSDTPAIAAPAGVSQQEMEETPANESTGNTAANEDEKQQGSLKAAITLVVIAVLCLGAAFVYRQRRALKLKNDYITKMVSGGDAYSDHAGNDTPYTDKEPPKLFGKSARYLSGGRPKRNYASQNIAPRPTEDRDLENELNDIVIDDGRPLDDFFGDIIQEQEEEREPEKELIFSETIDELDGHAITNSAIC